MAGCSYIAPFMAGATISGRRQASAAAVSRLSAWPPASLAIVFADAGAITKASARSTSSRCEIGAWSGAGSPGKAPRSGSGSHSVTSTGAPVIPANEAVPTKRVDASRLDHADAVARLDGKACQLERLVGGDAATDAEQEARHRSLPFLLSRGSGT